jgi:16S rRNA processing protein RimM
MAPENRAPREDHGGSGEPVWLSAGVVGRPHGLDGSFYVVAPSPVLLVAGRRVRLGGVEREIERRAGTDARPIVRVGGIEDRSGAEAARGAELLVTREQAPELEDDEWWSEDLEGCLVHDGDRSVGTVRRVLALPSCEVLEVEREGDALLVPLVTDAVRSVDVQARRIEVDLRFLGEE